MQGAQIIVTGGSRGIGAAVVEELATRGHSVVGLSRSGEVPAGRGLRCDVSDEAALRAAIADVASHGPIAGLVNNAGIHRARPSAELDLAEYEEVMRVNGTASVLACREVYPHLKAAGGGIIVNMGSFFDKLGVPATLAYSASKAVLGVLTRVLAVEWASDGISVLNVAPGYVRTELSSFWDESWSERWIERHVPLRRGGESEEVARLVAAIFGEQIRFLTGETLYLDGAHGIRH